MEPTRRNPQTNNVKQISKKFAGNIKKLDLLFLASPFSVASDALEPFSGARARTQSSWGRRGDSCGFSLYWRKSWGRLSASTSTDSELGTTLSRPRCPVPPLPSVPFVLRKRPGYSRSPPWANPDNKSSRFDRVASFKSFIIWDFPPPFWISEVFFPLLPPFSPPQRGDSVRVWPLWRARRRAPNPGCISKRRPEPQKNRRHRFGSRDA